MKAFKIVSLIIGVISLVIIIFFNQELLLVISLSNGSTSNGPESKNGQLTQRAIDTGDYTICREVEGGPIMSTVSFKKNCYEAVLLKLDDPKLCELDEVAKMMYSKDYCYESLARGMKNEIKDKFYCGKISSTYLKDSCYYYVINGFRNPNENIKSCELISEEGRSGCHSHFASIENNPILCETSNLQKVRNECYDSSFQYGYSVCGNIENKEYKSKCQDRLDTYIIDRIASDSSREDCNFINSDEIRSDCLRRIGK